MTRSEALARAMKNTGTSGRALAAKMGVTERIVRNLLGQVQPLTPSRVAALPPRVRAAFERELAGPALQLPLF